jgi:hypothetical protein
MKYDASMTVQLYLELLCIPVTGAVGLWALARMIIDGLRDPNVRGDEPELHQLRYLMNVVVVLAILTMIYIAIYHNIEGISRYGSNDIMHVALYYMGLIAAFIAASALRQKLERTICLAAVSLSAAPSVIFAILRGDLASAGLTLVIIALWLSMPLRKKQELPDPQDSSIKP